MLKLLVLIFWTVCWSFIQKRHFDLGLRDLRWTRMRKQESLRGGSSPWCTRSTLGRAARVGRDLSLRRYSISQIIIYFGILLLYETDFVYQPREAPRPAARTPPQARRLSLHAPRTGQKQPPLRQGPADSSPRAALLDHRHLPPLASKPVILNMSFSYYKLPSQVQKVYSYNRHAFNSIPTSSSESLSYGQQLLAHTFTPATSLPFTNFAVPNKIYSAAIIGRNQGWSRPRQLNSEEQELKDELSQKQRTLWLGKGLALNRFQKKRFDSAY